MDFKMSRSRWFDLAFVAGLVILYFTGGLTWLQSRLLGLIAGQPAIEESSIATLTASDWDWDLRRLDGTFVKLEDFKGKPILVNRWATWCGPCQAEMPFLQSVYKQYGDRIAVVLVSNEEPGILEAWLEKRNYTMPVYRISKQAPTLFQTQTIPVTWLIDPQGQVMAKHSGAARWSGSRVENAIDEMLATSQ
jgi:thiol-disulfide isomerase/thioredoxin